jgi:tetratricopeptide (TPR) repeat protein
VLTGGILVGILSAMLLSDVAATASEPGFWSAAAAPLGEPGLVERAKPSGSDLVAAAEQLRRALAKDPDDVVAGLALAEIEARRGREVAALGVLQGLAGRGAAGAEPAVWARLAGLLVKLGRYGEAAAAYEAAGTLAPPSADLYANQAEVLMADGRLGEAEARYRDAVAAASAEITGERRPRAQDLALAYYGLGVALDRDGQTTASREMIGRAVALDPDASLLKVAAAGDGDLFFVPEGDVYYYLGLAAEAQGQAMDAEAAFREYVARRPEDRWTPAAATHLAAAPSSATPGSRASERAAARRTRARVVAFGTVQASGGIAAPLVDAAWRAQVGLLDDCLERATASGSVRISVELALDARGRVTRATVKAPALGDAFARCAEAAVKERLVVAVPRRSKATSVRTDVLLAFP